MKFFKGFLVFILIAVIIGGVGYIGYSFLFMGGMDHSANSSSTSQTQQPADTNTNTAQNQQGMQHDSANNQPQQNNNQQAENNQIAINQSNIILQNKEKLDKAAASINESFSFMTVDPYAPGTNNSGNMSGMDNMQTPQQSSNVTVQPAQDNTATVTTPGNNTTINIYPQNNSTMQPNITQNNTMQNMGTTYDANKMEQLHTGLYKIAVGRALLNQLKDELVYQAEYATSNIRNPVQYYSNQYNLAVQNNNKLNQALTYINESANLININPYVSATGFVYDKDRMNQIHQSILMLADGVVTLNQLNDSFTKQTIYLANTVQNYVNNANYADTQQMNHAAISTGLFGGLFDNISMASVINIILILFVIGLVFGIFGFIYSLLKAPAKKYSRKEDEVI